jgi:hypothetical protein
MNKACMSCGLSIPALILLAGYSQPAALSLLEQQDALQHRFLRSIERPVNPCAKLPNKYPWLAGAVPLVPEAALRSSEEALDACGAPKA